MIRPVRYLSILLLLITLSLSCKKNNKDFNPSFKYNYFPLKVGGSVLYDVDTIKFSPLIPGGKDTFRWEIKETITDKFLDNEGREAYRFERYQRKDSSKPWILPRVGHRLIDGTRAESFENNLRFISLVFPPATGMKWQGNKFINLNDTLKYYRDWLYEYIYVDQPDNINGVSMDSTLLVKEIDDENLLEYRFSESVYGMDIGLVRQTRYNLKFVGSVIPDKPWEEKATHGFIVFKTFNRILK
jgi:hypothetical protein